MATKPTALPAWATDLTNNTEPSAGQKATGWTVNQVAVSSYFNWLAKNYYDWASYLNDGSFQGAIALASDISPAAITGAQNNYNPTGLSTAQIIRQDLSGASSLTGLAGGADGRLITIINVHASLLLTLNHENASSTAGNRFSLGGADLILGPNDSASFWYDSTSSRWRLSAAPSRKLVEIWIPATAGMFGGQVADHSNWQTITGSGGAGLIEHDDTGAADVWTIPIVGVPVGAKIVDVVGRIRRSSDGTLEMSTRRRADGTNTTLGSDQTSADGATTWANLSNTGINHVVLTGNVYFTVFTTGGTDTAQTLGIDGIKVTFYPP